MGAWRLGALLEQKLAPLVGLSPEVRRGLVKMGDKSEAFCRETLMVLAQNTHLLPPSFDLADARNDLTQLDKLRPLTTTEISHTWHPMRLVRRRPLW